MFFSSVFIYVIQLCEHSSVWPALFNRSAGSILRCLMLLSVIFFVIVYFSSGTLFTRYFICFRADLMTHLLFWHKFRDDEGIYGEESLFKLNFHKSPLSPVWKSKPRRGLEGLKSPPYSILNKKWILASPTPMILWLPN